MSSPQKSKPKKSANEYLKYSGMAVQLFVYIFLGYFIGSKVDKYLGFEKPIFAIIGLLLLFFGYMYSLVNDVNKNK